MPELPEVETVRRSLRPFLEGRRIVGFRAVWKKALGGVSERKLGNQLDAQRIRSLERRAKYLVLVLERGWLTVHLRMTGKLYPLPAPPQDTKHVSALFALDDGQVLVFHDVRRFGTLEYISDASRYADFQARFGPEPLGKAFTPERLLHDLRHHRRALKPLLLDQQFLAGLGNIYVDEALWEARLHPLNASDRISDTQAARLHAAIQLVLSESIQKNGTTFMDFKFLGGQRGGYTDSLRVFRREGQACPRCGHVIRKLRVAQRGTHICEKCQKPPRSSAHVG